MFRRIIPVFMVTLLLSVMLVACGDEAAPVPTYTGATSIPVADSIKTQMGSSLASVKNATVDAFKTSDTPDKVKAGFDSSFKGSNWTNQAITGMSADTTKQLETVGAFVVGYKKGNKSAAVIGFPGGPIAQAIGFPDVADGTVYIVISGNE